jgi:hypothetical protein
VQSSSSRQSRSTRSPRSINASPGSSPPRPRRTSRTLARYVSEEGALACRAHQKISPPTITKPANASQSHLCIAPVVCPKFAPKSRRVYNFVCVRSIAPLQLAARSARWSSVCQWANSNHATKALRTIANGRLCATPPGASTLLTPSPSIISLKSSCKSPKIRVRAGAIWPRQPTDRRCYHPDACYRFSPESARLLDAVRAERPANLLCPHRAGESPLRSSVDERVQRITASRQQHSIRKIESISFGTASMRASIRFGIGARTETAGPHRSSSRRDSPIRSIPRSLRTATTTCMSRGISLMPLVGSIRSSIVATTRAPGDGGRSAP